MVGSKCLTGPRLTSFLSTEPGLLVTGVFGEESFTSNLSLTEVRSLFMPDDPMEEAPKKKPRRMPKERVELDV